TSRTACATARSATPRATSSASSSGPELRHVLPRSGPDPDVRHHGSRAARRRGGRSRRGGDVGLSRAAGLVPAAYRPVLAHRVLRRLILGFAVSYLGDGMSFVAVAWLAIEIAPESSTGLWVGAAVAAYTLPGVVGALALGRRLRRISPQRLMIADNVVRAVF